ncbi:hypothetical protein K431DRAFT_295279 [Polychaeton citri CBS 116435]|uniref:Ankyrin n=1 Tax=Polychaeton citri CBS 116435 TaxID=1314669 RepID=A0A9P4Q448_9PEZI|nr:hypothetical protein K431DRAFT_295279 [Polychaeton citri CBS 116435]
MSFGSHSTVNSEIANQNTPFPNPSPTNCNFTMPGDGKRSLFPRRDRFSFASAGPNSPNVPVPSSEAPNKSITRRRLRDVFRTHEWMPQVRSATGIGHSSTFKGNMIRPAGRPPRPLTQDQTDALIVLIVKTDIAFNDIPAAMSGFIDPDTGRKPTPYSIRQQWMKIFGGHPQEARLGSEVGQLRRLEDQREACERFYRQHGDSQSRIEARPRELGVNHHEPEMTQRDLFDSTARAPLYGAFGDGSSTEATLADEGPFIQYGLDPRPTQSSDHSGNGAAVFQNTRKRPVSTGPERSRAATLHEYQSYGTRPASPTSHTSRKKRSSAGLTTTSQVANKYGEIGFDQLQWYLQYRRGRGSWLSRISRSSRSSSFRERQSQSSPASTSLDLQNRPDLHDLLDKASLPTEPLPWSLLGDSVDNYVEAGADINGLNMKGDTPLHRAVRMGCLPAVVALLEAKAEPNAKDAQGRSVSASARDFIRSTQPDDSTVAHIEVARELIKYNAQLDDTVLKCQKKDNQRPRSRKGETMTSLSEGSTFDTTSGYGSTHRNEHYPHPRDDAPGSDQRYTSTQFHSLSGSGQQAPATPGASGLSISFSDTHRPQAPQTLMHGIQMQPQQNIPPHLRPSTASMVSFGPTLSNASASTGNNLTSLANVTYPGGLQGGVNHENNSNQFAYDQTPFSSQQDLFPLYTEANAMPQDNTEVWPQQSMQRHDQTSSNVDAATNHGTMNYIPQQVPPAPMAYPCHRQRVANGSVQSHSVQPFFDNTIGAQSSSGPGNPGSLYHDPTESPYNFDIRDFQSGFDLPW